MVDDIFSTPENKNKMKFKTKFTIQDTEDYRKWISFYPHVDMMTPFKIQLCKWGYFDPRMQFNFNVTSIIGLMLPFISIWLLPLLIISLFIGWGKVYLRLPFYTPSKTDECDYPSYGLNTFSHGMKIVDELWVYWGKRRKHIRLPWYLEWYSTSMLRKDGTWEIEKRGDRKNFYDQKWDDVKFKETHPYKYMLQSGKLQEVEATIYVEKREWRRLWLYRLPLFNKISTSIDVSFSSEVGEGTGSWKGGTVRCSYNIKPGETPYETLKRMEQERQFNR